MEAFLGTWQLISTENFVQYLEARGISAAMLKYLSDTKGTLILTQDGDSIVFKTKMYGAGNKSYTTRFKLGEEFEDSTIDFQTCRSVYNLEDGKLVHIHTWEENKVTVIREIQDGKMITTFSFGDVSSVHIYEKI